MRFQYRLWNTSEVERVLDLQANLDEHYDYPHSASMLQQKASLILCAEEGIVGSAEEATPSRSKRPWASPLPRTNLLVTTCSYPLPSLRNTRAGCEAV